MRFCDVPDCSRVVHARGLCNGHHHRLLRGSSLDSPIRVPFVNPLVCVCEAPLLPSSIGECQRCYRCVPALLHPKAVQA